MVTFPSNGGTAEGYLARPADGNGPGVVVIQEYWGLVPHIQDLCDRFADEGFVALAPDFFHGKKASEPDDAMRLMMGMAMDQAAKDIAGAAAWLDARDDTDGHGVGAVGFCMGGSLALWSATLSEHVRATVGFYPAVPWERMNPTWSNYTGKAAEIHNSEQDGLESAEGVQIAKQAIEAAGGTVKVYGYPGTQHAFVNDTRPEVYAESAAKEALQRTYAFLRHQLGTS